MAIIQQCDASTRMKISGTQESHLRQTLECVLVYMCVCIWNNKVNESNITSE